MIAGIYIRNKDEITTITLRGKKERKGILDIVFDSFYSKR